MTRKVEKSNYCSQLYKTHDLFSLDILKLQLFSKIIIGSDFCHNSLRSLCTLILVLQYIKGADHYFY